MPENNGKINGHLPYILIALLGGGVVGTGGGAGGSWLYFSRLAPAQIQEMARPYPFTSLDAEKLINRLEALEEHDYEQDRRMDQLPPRALTDSLLRLELQLEHLTENLESHEDGHD